MLDIQNWRLASCFRQSINSSASISPIEWKSRAAEKMPFEDMPLRTVKTILHELTQAVGPRVLDEAKAILPKTSFVISYLMNMVNSISIKESNSTNLTPSGGLVQPSSTPIDAVD